MLEEKIRPVYQKILVDPVAQLVAKFPFLTPTTITWASAVIGCFVFIFLWVGWPLLACLTLWLSGYFDTLDGTLARLTNRSSNQGAMLDIVVDRFVEAAVVIGLFVVAPESRGLLCLLMLASILLCVTTFLIVGVFTENDSSKSFYYSSGLMERAEAFVFFSFMMLLPNYFTPLALLFTLLVLWTAGYRTYQYLQQARS